VTALRLNFRSKARSLRIAGAVIFLASSMARASQASQNPVNRGSEAPNQDNSIGSVTQQLAQFSVVLGNNPTPAELTSLKESLPKEWTVTTAERQYTIPTDYLRAQLTAGAAQNAKSLVDHLASELGSYPLTRPASKTDSRAELDRILAGSEFAAVHPPTAWDVFRQRLAEWIGKILARILGGLERYPIGGQILFWIVIVACVGFVGLWFFRLASSRDRVATLPPGRMEFTSRTWQEWIHAARQAANRGDFREAVHSAYWAGITRMEILGALPKDPSITPREYLRLVTEPVEGELASRASYREPLAALTIRLEKIWYANRGAGAEDYRDALRQLEAMGCRLE
jgi:hypothetical protein